MSILFEMADAIPLKTDEEEEEEGVASPEAEMEDEKEQLEEVFTNSRCFETAAAVAVAVGEGFRQKLNSNKERPEII